MIGRVFRAPNLLQRDKDLPGNHKRVQDDAVDSDCEDLDEDGEDRDRCSSLDDDDKDEELADFAVEDFDEEVSENYQ